ncbi:ATP12 family chaperone protein [Alloyangia pacifica]|uniref:ATP12 family chaperone protein n=1 Tax=Alloyangia pacifica TaxID=311180 RepID=UPI001CD811A1|nr:ATP12 family protein [Alloyangia pacifica]MCA0997820.1 ATPase [Alloyangia pacifica]
MSEWAPRRFYKDATVEEAEGGFTVHLDGRPLRTPGKAALVVPSRAIAEAMAEEWRAQDEKIDPSTMPFTRTANSAIDKVATQHADVADMLAEYGDSDLLCYRADSPEMLVQRQQAQWDPLLNWAERELGARLETRQGLMHAPQPEPALRVLRERTHALSPFELAAFHDLVALTGSLVLGFAATGKAHDAEEIWALSRLDESFQAELWGEDEEATEAAEIKRDAFLHAHRFFALCGTA